MEDDIAAYYAVLAAPKLFVARSWFRGRIGEAIARR